MRQIGTLPEEQALRFADYLLTLGITSRVEATKEGCALWIHREDHLDRAREEFQRFRDEPNASRYLDARREAEAVRRRKEKEERDYQKRTVDLRNRLSGPGSTMGPVTRGLLIVCIGLFLLNWFAYQGRPFSPLSNALYFSEWYVADDGRLANRGLAPIFEGQVWRLITPTLLHGGILHLFFNMYMLSMLGGAVERRRRVGEYVALLLVAAVFSDIAQFFLPDVFTVPTARGPDRPFVGMSGVIYALFGYAWMRGKYDPASGLQLHPQTVIILMAWLVVCAFNLLGPIANTAHVAGLLAGIGFSFASMARDGVFR
jgi:GlpG protein